jgi:UDP-galactopyranose mutase
MSRRYVLDSHFGEKGVPAVGDRFHLEQASSTNSRQSETPALQSASSGVPDLVCLSHLRWDFVYQRPQHLLSRCAQMRRVFFIEEPMIDSDDSIYLDVSQRESGVWVAIPHLPEGLSEEKTIAIQQKLLDYLFADTQIHNPILWYYTPMAVPFTDHINASAVVYDCMDELAAFKGAHPQLQAREADLFKLADLVFTGGRSLYEAKQHQHPNVHAFPSSIDAAHFAQARNLVEEPTDQAAIPHPRLGFYGVIDERMDLDLLDAVAKARPEWHFVIIGPVVKIDPATLPRYSNIHYLGGKSYQELPSYLAGWDVALLPFACNESTRFISPTKTPEYLAAGKPVVSTSIRDVVRPYGEEKLVHIADTAPEFVSAIEAAIDQGQTDSDWLNRVDSFVAQISWDLTWNAMNELIEAVIMAEAQRVNSDVDIGTNASANASTDTEYEQSKQLISIIDDKATV